MVYVVMGVAGCGKTTVGNLLAKRICAHFVDADDYHPQSSISKIKQGVPLTDEDRFCWLGSLSAIISEYLRRAETLVLACSALKGKYRRTLTGCSPLGVRFIYLKCKVETVKRRLAEREGHFAPLAIADSQFADLEEPRLAFTVDGENSPEFIVDQAVKWIYGWFCGC
ncbi:MAG: AAA family ATPase [Chitinispirillales bacterium]|jgi:carbohydrate kinase (thermoresistant glucokinase family)|nr:AAA family ATPase [Chitinispirillales bacterium]